MKKNTILWLAAGCAIALVAGCGTTAAVTPPGVPAAKHSSKPRPASIPAPLVIYARSVLPVLNTTVHAAQTLLGQMGHEDYETLGYDCANAGGTFSDLKENYRGPVAPRQARSATASGNAGFGNVLSSIDECGMAVDAQSPTQLKVAAADLGLGLRQISGAQRLVQTWAKLR